MPAKKTNITEVSVVQRPFPVNLRKEDQEKFEHEISRSVSAAVLYEFTDAIVNSDGIVIENRKIVPASLFDESHTSFIGGYYLLLNKLRIRKRILDSEQYLLCFNYWGDGYFHWMTETLPRLWLLRKQLPEMTLLLPEKWPVFYDLKSMRRSFTGNRKAFNIHGFHPETLKPFSIKKTEFIKENEQLLISHLHLAGPVASSGNYNEKAMKGVRDLFRNYFYKNESPVLSSLIYVSRRKAGKRYVENEQLIEPLLKEFGFTFLHFEDFTFEDQVRIAAHAKIMISAHGAGLTNQMFMAEKTAVIELRLKGDANNLCYFSLAAALNQHYLYQFCDASEIGTSFHRANLIADIQELRKNIELALSIIST